MSGHTASGSHSLPSLNTASPALTDTPATCTQMIVKHLPPLLQTPLLSEPWTPCLAFLGLPESILPPEDKFRCPCTPAARNSAPLDPSYSLFHTHLTPPPVTSISQTHLLLSIATVFPKHRSVLSSPFCTAVLIPHQPQNKPRSPSSFHGLQGSGFTVSAPAGPPHPTMSILWTFCAGYFFCP